MDRTGYVARTFDSSKLPRVVVNNYVGQVVDCETFMVFITVVASSMIKTRVSYGTTFMCVF